MGKRVDKTTTVVSENPKRRYVCEGGMENSVKKWETGEGCETFFLTVLAMFQLPQIKF